MNRVSFIEQTLESIKAQTYTDIEKVVVDGASSDGTLSVLHKVLDENSVLISEPDHGLYDALNKGFGISTGEVIGVLHSDDVFADEMVLAEVAEAFANPDVDAVYGDLAYVARNNIKNVVRYWRAGEFSHKKLVLGWMPPHPTLFLRREVIENLGGFDTNYQISADYDAILRYFSQDRFHVEYIDRVLVKMRLGGLSNKSLSKILKKSFEDYQILKKNKIGGFRTLIWKNLTKLKQFRII